ncbi:outer membrane beta-barrel family protein [Hymenobacter sp. BT491]|uniref:outer membrane beta-barrel family protein n=1 Tax=Hymenobacter sp. BT491 TaxID=2766779 RepID=UPI001653D69A|nr:outer membrane beta-barrel family protein [Hymenobacter sp. BT491]MBC6988710.1 TonB-dependent receptor [Hymenobacter sp. BT491]
MKPTLTSLFRPQCLRGLLFWLLYFCLGRAVVGQPAEGMLSGTVKDAKGAAVSFANVVVLNAATNALVTGVAADEAGKFSLRTPAPGAYLLKVTMLGYASLQTPSFTVGNTDFRKDFGVLTLQNDAKMLQEVTVQALRPTVVKEADRMIVNVEGTPLAAGSTAYEVLTKSPGVAVDQDGNLQLNGKAGVQVLLDGKRSYLSGKELQALLQAMPADNLKSLELITNPSAKYDAAGSAGIINLNLKKNQVAGLNGSVYAGYQYQYSRLHGYSTGANLNYKKGKWNTSLGVDMARRTRFRTNQMHREFRGEAATSTFDQNDHENGVHYVPAVRLSADYALNRRHSLGVTASLTQRNANDAFRTGTYLRTGYAPDDLFIQANNQAHSVLTNGAANLHYVGQLDTVGTTISADADYVRLFNDNNSTFQNRFDSLGRAAGPFSTLLTSHNPTHYDIYSAKTDFAKPLTKTTKLELGAKASRVVSDNELNFFALTDGQAVPDATRSSHFRYQEDIYAAYANVAARLGQQWSVQGGLRAEQTRTHGHSLTLAQSTQRSYLGLFPSLQVQQTISPDYQISYSYSRRIDRPQYETLNPFIFYLDPYSWIKGNPSLKPQYTSALEVGQMLKHQYSLTVGYAVTKGYIAEIPEQRAVDQTTVFQQQNVNDFQNLNATLLAPVTLAKNWQITNTASVAYQRFTKVLQGQTLTNEQVSFTARSSQSVQLPRQFRLQVSAGYQGPMAYGLYQLKANWWVDAGLKRSFLHDQLDLSLSATDLFRSRLLKATANLNGNINAISLYSGSQTVRLTLGYRFSKGAKFEAVKHSASLEELNRTGKP